MSFVQTPSDQRLGVPRLSWPSSVQGFLEAKFTVEESSKTLGFLCFSIPLPQASAGLGKAPQQIVP